MPDRTSGVIRCPDKKVKIHMSLLIGNKEEIKMNLQGKKVLVFGSGKSGIGAAELLAKVGAQPVIYDGNKDLDKETVIKKVPDCNNIEVYAGELPEEVQKRLDLAVLSPGVPTDIPLVKSFYEQGLPVWGEVELAYRTGKGRVLAITGTNGKTTTTALLGKIMSDAEYELLYDVVRGADDIVIDGTGLVLCVHFLRLLVFLVFNGDSGFLLEAVDY